MHFAIVSVTILATSAAGPAQRTRGTVQLEAADCSRTRVTFGNQQVAHAVQRAAVPFGVGTLEVRPGGNGGVRIERGSGSDYAITACIGAGAETLEEAQRAVEGVNLDVQGNRVTLSDARGARSWSVHLIVEAPRGARIDVQTANGPIAIDGVDGSIMARASNGPIDLDDVSGTIRAVAVNGPISISGSRGHLDLETQNGPISVDLQGTRWEGELRARAHNGPLTLRVNEEYASGLEISSSGRGPWSCRIAACTGRGPDSEQGGRSLRLGSEPVLVRISTVNGPVTIDRSR